MNSFLRQTRLAFVQSPALTWILLMTHLWEEYIYWKHIWCQSVCPLHNSWHHTSYNPKPSEAIPHTPCHRLWGERKPCFNSVGFCFWSRHGFRVRERFLSYFCSNHLVTRVPVQQSAPSFYCQLVGYWMIKLQTIFTKIKLNLIHFV